MANQRQENPPHGAPGHRCESSGDELKMHLGVLDMSNPQSVVETIVGRVCETLADAIERRAATFTPPPLPFKLRLRALWSPYRTLTSAVRSGMRASAEQLRTLEHRAVSSPVGLTPGGSFLAPGTDTPQ